MIGYRIIPPTPGIALAAGPQTPAFVSGAFFAGNAVTKTVTVADKLIVIQGSNGTQTPGISDTAGNSWTAITGAPFQDTSNGYTFTCWWADASATGSTTVNITASGTAPMVGIGEWSGLLAGPPDKVTSRVAVDAGTTSPNATQTGSVTPSANGELIISFVIDVVGAPSVTQYAQGTSPNAFTKRPTVMLDPGGASVETSAVEDFVQTTAAAINPTWTATAADDYDGFTLAFKHA